MKRSPLALFVLVWIFTLQTWAIEVQLAEAPKNDLVLTINSIKSAQQSLLINVYELTSPAIKDAIVDKILEGVHVEILLEGQPVVGRKQTGRRFEGEIIEAMHKMPESNNHFFIMGSNDHAPRRFRFDHAKYDIIDGKFVLIGSENASPTGQPESGYTGNRGWEVGFTHNIIAKKMTQIFHEDSDINNSDVVDALREGALADIFDYDFMPEDLGDSSKLPKVAQASSATIITSPDNSKQGLLALLNNAKKSIDLELLSLSSTWGQSPNSPLINAIIDAANRGVRVRVLLNDDAVFDHGKNPEKRKNVISAKLLNQASKNIIARIADLKAMGVDCIHNKGMLIDGNITLVSSINWNQNSIENNREVGVVLTGKQIYNHYEAIFQSDWKASAKSAIH